LDPAVWNRLPERDDGLLKAASTYYGTRQLLEIAGSQAAIQLLPMLREPCRVAIVSPCYAEHEMAWKKAGHQILLLKSDDIEQKLDELDVVLVVNPNNPTGERLPVEKLNGWHEKLSKKDGWLVVDEAFMDATETESLVREVIPPGLIILRSVGKFFGLAGARVGFLLGEALLLNRVRGSFRALGGLWSKS
jgi:Histidinol-phosphate/aromatic aminotransferase and cobyric acid decarboxylase